MQDFICVPNLPVVLVRPDKVPPDLPTIGEVPVATQVYRAVKLDLDAAYSLRRAGLRVPAPILAEPFPPGTFRAQKVTAAFLTMNPRAFVLSSMGTGKTRAVVLAMRWLRRHQRFRRALIIAPLSTLEPVWMTELMRFMPEAPATLLLSGKRRRIYHDPWQIGVINHDGLVSLYDMLLTDPNIDMLVVDEVASFRTPSALRTKALIRIAANKPWVWGLTGSPTPNSPVDAWAQVCAVNPARVRNWSFGKWRRHVTEQVDSRRWRPLSDAAAKVVALMKPAIRFSREQVVDLPPLTVTTRLAEMTREQSAAYNKLKRDLIYQYQQGQVTAANAGVLLSKLLQVAAGVVYDDNGQEHDLPAGPRLGVVRELVEEADAKVLVLAGFRSVIRRVVTSLDGLAQTAIIDGSVPLQERTDLIRRFQDDNDPLRVMVAHPGTMAHGLTLTAASTIIWYTPILSRERFEQANARITRPGQTRPQLQVRLVNSGIDKRVYTMLDNSLQFQAELLKLFEELEEL